MTENGKIFLVKNAIYDLLSQQQFSLGLSLYIIQDIERELQKGYKNILKQEFQQEQKQISKQQGQKQQSINTFSSGVYPVEWEPDEEKNEDQAN